MRTQPVEANLATTDTAPRWRPFLRHFAEMAIAMLVGMMLLDPLWSAVFGLAGLDGAPARPELVALITATDMTLAMTIWMRYRGHSVVQTAEMAAAMYAPFLVLMVPYWLGALPGEDAVMGGHALMLPAMAVAMLVRRAEYSVAHHGSYPEHSFVGVVGRRWPTWIALAMTLDGFWSPFVPEPWMLLALPAMYLVIGGIRGRLRDPRMLAVQLAGFALYLVLAVAALTVAPATAPWIVAAAVGSHSIWDFVHHRADAVVPHRYAEWCGVLDLVVAVTIVVSL